MLKNEYFLEKTVKNCLSVGPAPEPSFASGGWWLRSQTPAFLLSLIVTALSSTFLALNMFYSPQKEQNCYSKCSVFVSSILLHLFFISNSVIFIERGRKYISCPRAQGTLATPLLLTPGPF